MAGPFFRWLALEVAMCNEDNTTALTLFLQGNETEAALKLQMPEFNSVPW